jgi:hypothetical protein
MKHYVTDPKDINREIQVPNKVITNIINEYMINKYYTVIGFGSFMIGFLLGVIVK